MPDGAVILQICPNDGPPFRDICGTYERAAACLDTSVRSVFLTAPRGEPLAGAVYLGAAERKRTRPLARALERALERTVTDLPAVPTLAICHRYRSLKVLLASRVAVGRIVTVAHEFGLLERRRRRWYRALVAPGVRFAGVSPAVQADLARVVPDALCLPNALDLPAFDAALLPRAEALERLGIGEAAFTVAVVGRLIPWKRPDLAVAAWRRFADRERGRDVARLLLLGEGPLRASIEAAGAGLDVQVLGFRPDVRRLLKAVDALLVVSEPREAFGMAVLEAMAARVPVIAGPAPGPEFVTGGTAFRYAEASADAIAEALAATRRACADGSAAGLIERARGRVEARFTAAALAERLRPLLGQDDR